MNRLVTFFRLIVFGFAILVCCVPKGLAQSAGVFSATSDLKLENVEGARMLEDCPYSLRTQLLPVDLDNDRRPEWLSFINCHQRTYEPGWWYSTPHDTSIGHAWMMLSVDEELNVVDSTERYFGATHVDISQGKPTGYVGGYGDISVTDINGDSLPDIMYYGSRDDTRPVDREGLIDDDPLYTWRMQQSLIVSNPKGEYEIQFVGSPYPNFRSQWVPNGLGGFDLWGVGFGSLGGPYFHRFDPSSGEWLDVSQTWAESPGRNELGNSYFNVINLGIESLGQPEVGTHLVQEFATEKEREIRIFELLTPGFKLLDAWKLPSLHFEYRDYEAGCDCLNNRFGFYWRGQATFGMAFEDFYSFKLNPADSPYILAHALGFALPEHRKFDSVDISQIFSNWYQDERITDIYRPAHLYVLFRLEDGKLIPTEQELIPDAIIRSAIYKTFVKDVNADGYDDLVLMTGSEAKPYILINDKAGRLRKLDPELFPENPIAPLQISERGIYQRSQYEYEDFDGDGLFDVAFYHLGFDESGGWETQYEDYADDAKWQSGNIEVFFAKRGINSSADVLSEEERLPYESDFDADGQKDIFDPDDDNDGRNDPDDMFPLDASEYVDTDEDGIGNNADLDDDGDGFSDEEELADGTDPLNRFSCRSGCFSFDIDENKEAKALTDGLLVIRHLFGFTGSALANGAVAGNADRNTADAIASFLLEAETELDVDGNGESKALSDGLLLIRYLFGFRDNALIAGAIGSGATRNTSEEIEAYIGDRIPVSE